MVSPTLRKLAGGLWPIIGLAALMLVSLKLMSDATENSASFGQLYSWLLLVNILGLILLVALIAVNLYRLLVQLRLHVAGSRLTARMVVMFVILAGTPVLMVYYFSLQFLHRGIESWFDVKVENALTDALELSRTALGLRMREVHRETEQMAVQLQGVPDVAMALRLTDLRERAGPTELAVLSSSGRIIAASTGDTTTILPSRPSDTVLLQVRQSGSYIGLDPGTHAGLQIRVVVTIPEVAPKGDARILQALFLVTERMNELADSVQSAFTQYRELAYLRTPLKQTFTLTLSLVLLLSLLSAVWAAFFSARRLAAPIRDLAEGTRAVAAGDYETQLPRSGSDEMGFLVASFNDMTRRIALARDEARRSQQELEEQHNYLGAVLARLSSGVLTFDHEQCLYTSNEAASQILGVDLSSQSGLRPAEIGRRYPNLAALTDTFRRHLGGTATDWREEISLFGRGGRQVLMCRGTPLSGTAHTRPGHVIVFDDVTALIQAQKNAAWGEVARRLAHEIKNPLTPIQLSAERLRHKYLAKMEDRDREILDRLTHTIIQQVEAMKEMVNAFSSYARTPQIRPRRLDVNKLVSEVLELYRFDRGERRVEGDLDPALPAMEADAGRLRQVLHNLIKNALETTPGEDALRVTVTTRCVQSHGCTYIDITVEDNGTGFPAEILEQAFEPYVTTKTKGTGLGLAIVKKIAEEHSGMVAAENRAQGGALVRLRFPAASAGTGEPPAHPAAREA
jgi:nitrogen fixation/metabolism regulation signal transduction histidine kinase